MKKIKNVINSLIVILIFISFNKSLFAQVESPLQIFNRGMLWQSVLYGKNGPTFSNWKKTGIGLDWPAFDETWVKTDIGGSPSYMISGGFFVGAKSKPDSVLAVEDWSMYGTTITSDASGKYRILKHSHNYKNGSNYWLQTNPKVGEEVIESIWEYNPNYVMQNDVEVQLPVRVRRTVHQWSGSKSDENYIIYEYVFKNISAEIKSQYPTRNVSDTLYEFRLMMTYGLHANSRAWTVLFPQKTPGARNTWFVYDPFEKMIWGRAGDYYETSSDDSYGKTMLTGLVKNGKTLGEYLAPGFVGVKLLYASPNSNGQSTYINKYGWSAADGTFDFSGPFNGVSGYASDRYKVLANPSLAYQFIQNIFDTTYMKKSRMWSIMTLGPWNLLPGDSIIIAFAEAVDGVSYKIATDTTYKPDQLFTLGYDGAFAPTMSKAQFTYDQYRDPSTGQLTGKGLNHPDPPAAPEFKVEFLKSSSQFVANVITWGKEAESIADPDDGTYDLAGYKLYRSGFLPIGPWDLIATIKVGDPLFYNSTAMKYTFIDTTVDIGTSYYYALTAYDSGKSSWNIDPSGWASFYGSLNVPSLESSIYASSNLAIRKNVTPFLATLPSLTKTDEVLVVPNPFVLGQGSSQPGAGDDIQFVNIPNPCTIRIYTVRGDLVKTIEVGNNVGGIISWNQVTDFGQFVESGIYVFCVESSFGKKIGKFAIVR